MPLTHDLEFFSANFWQKTVISGSEISLVPTDLAPKTFGPWLGVLFWIILLSVPLSGIQRAQTLTGATYVLFVVASAAAMGVMFCLPWVGYGLSPMTFVLLTVAAALGTWRWQRGSSALPMTTQGTQEKGSTP